MGKPAIVTLFFLTAAVGMAAQGKHGKHKWPRADEISTASLISEAGPSFMIRQKELGRETKVILYGDQRFTDPRNTRVTNPTVRKWIVAKIAEENPDAVLMNGDVPYSGDNRNDYAVFKTETAIWREKHLRVFPALGNHEFHGNPQQALEHWWSAFPELRGRRWYSVQLGDAIYVIVADSDASLLAGSEQLQWLNEQLRHLPESTKFVFIDLHHPPVADIQTRVNVSHNPRPNEIELRDDLDELAPKVRAKIIVCAGHIHNYERFERNGVTYLVEGGGGASPVIVERKPGDLYQDSEYPNYGFVEFDLDGKVMKGSMYRLADAAGATPQWQIKDRFEVAAGN